MSIDGYEKPTICAACGGLCCQRYPGILWPSDVRPLSSRKIAELLGSGKYQIDWWEDASPGYFLRAAVIGDERVYSPTWGGRCVFLRATGCELAFRRRPYQCRMLEPKPGDEPCDGHGCDKWTAAEAWRRHHRMLHQAARRNKDIVGAEGGGA